MGSFSSKYLKDIWNLPNILTMLRLVLIPVFAGLFLAGYEKWALAVFIIASITDYLDGYLARKNNQITAFGKLMDPLADKLMVCTALLGQGLSGVFPWPAILIVMTKEVVMIIGGIYMLQNGIVVYSNILGKAAQFSFIAALILSFWHKEFVAASLPLDCECYMLGKWWTGAYCRYFREAVLPLDPVLMASICEEGPAPDTRLCAVCGRPFLPEGRQAYCSDACKAEGNRRRSRERMRKKRRGAG